MINFQLMEIPLCKYLQWSRMIQYLTLMRSKYSPKRKTGIIHCGHSKNKVRSLKELPKYC